MRGNTREQFPCPGDSRYGGDAPLDPVFQLVLVRTRLGIAHLLDFQHFILVDAFQTVRIIGFQINPAGNFIQIMFKTCFLIDGQVSQGFYGTVADMQFVQRLVFPVHDNPGSTCLVAFFHEHPDKFGLIQACSDEYFLSFPDIDAASGNQAGIFFQSGFLHSVHFFLYGLLGILSIFSSAFRSGGIRKLSRLF